MTIKSQNESGALIVRVGAQGFSLAVLTALLVEAILWGVGIQPAWKGFRHALHTGQSVGGYILGLIALSGLAAFLAYLLLLTLFQVEVIILTPTDLEIRTSIFGLIRSHRSVPNTTVEKLRYEEWSAGKAGMQHGLRFECVGETITFAMNATAAECSDILDQMLEAYKFSIPKPAEDEPSPAVVRW